MKLSQTENDAARKKLIPGFGRRRKSRGGDSKAGAKNLSPVLGDSGGRAARFGG